MVKANSAFFRPPDAETDLVVVRVRPEQAKTYAPGILGVMTTAYARQFEAAEGEKPEPGQLPAGAAKAHFRPDDRNNHGQQADRMHAYMRGGSAYWAAYDSKYFEPGEDMLGIAKTSPSRGTVWQKIAGKVSRRLDNPNCYVNDIAVSEPRRGVASALLYVALHDYSSDRSVVADVLPGTEGFFETNDFTAGGQQEYMQVGDGLLRPTRYEAPSAGAVTAGIEFRYPWMRDAAVFSA